MRPGVDPLDFGATGGDAVRVSDVIERLERTGAQLVELVTGVREEQWSHPTPCSEWDVAGLVRHVVLGNRIFVGVLAGHPVNPPVLLEEYASHGARLLPGDASESVADLVAAFRRPEVMQQAVTIPAGTVPGSVAAEIRVVENIVHGWDLSAATGQESSYLLQDVEDALAFTERTRGIVPEGRTPFAEPVAVAGDAAPLDRLVALLGRQPVGH